MEKDGEVKGEGNSYTTEFRQYDSRLGRWLSLDPLMGKYPAMSPFNSFNNNPVFYIDPLGLEGQDWIKKEGSNQWEWDSKVKSKKDAEDKYGKGTDYAAPGFEYTATVNGKKAIVTLGNKDEGTNQGWEYRCANPEDGAPEASVDELAGASSTYQAGEYEHGPITNPGAGEFLIGNSAEDFAELREAWGDSEDWERFNGYVNNFAWEAVLFASGESIFHFLSKSASASNIIREGEEVFEEGTRVIGHYPEYVNLAQKGGGKYFNIPSHIWNKLTPAQQWAANTKFLDRLIAHGGKVRLATPLTKVKPGSFLEKEINYLMNHGYSISEDGLWLVK